MAGLNLAAIGAGLGQFAQQYQQQKAAQERQQMLAITLARYQQEQKDRAAEQQAASARWSLDDTGTGAGLSGAGDLSQMSNFEGGAPKPQPTGGGGMRAGGGLSVENMTQLATQAGFSPDKAPIMAAIAMGESSGNPAAHNTKGENSYGLTQINADAHGPIAREALDPKRAFELAYKISNGGTNFNPWTIYRNGAYRSYLRPGGTGQGRAPPSTEAQPEAAEVGGVPPAGQTVGAGGYRYDIGSDEARAAIGQAPVAPREQRVAQAGPPTATDAGTSDLQARLDKIPLPSVGGDNFAAIKARIVRQMPGAGPEVWQKALDGYIKQLSPQIQQRHQDQLKQYEARRDAVTRQWELENRRQDSATADQRSQANWEKQHSVTRGETLADRDATGGSIATGPGGEQFNVQGAGARPILRADTGEPLVKEGAKKASQNIQVVGEDGKDIFKGSAHPDPNAKEGESSWIDDRTQKRIDIPDTASVTQLGKGGEGRAAAAQMVRLTTGANEARRQISNVARMSQGATTSWFQGVQAMQGKNLADGVKRTLADEITPREQQIMSALGIGIGRSLATLETAGAATGLVGLQQSMQGIMPAKGDDVSTTLLKIGEMRQIAEQGIASALALRLLGEKQRQLLQEVLADLEKAVPWTVADVIDMIQKPGAETYQTFAAKIGLGQKGGGAPGGAATPQPGDLRKGYIFRGGDPADPKSWTKAPPGAVETTPDL